MVPKVAVSIGYYPSLGFQGVCTQRHSWNPRVLIQDSWMFSSWLTSSKPPKNRVVQSSSRSFDSEVLKLFHWLSMCLQDKRIVLLFWCKRWMWHIKIRLHLLSCWNELLQMQAGWIVWKQLETIRGICDARERCSNWPSPCPLPILSQYYCALFTCSDPLPCSPALPPVLCRRASWHTSFLSP